MDVSSVSAGAVAALGSGGVTASIAVSLIASSDQAAQQQIATLFSTIGLGRNFSATA
jgi:hypothetical protein